MRSRLRVAYLALLLAASCTKVVYPPDSSRSSSSPTSPSATPVRMEFRVSGNAARAEVELLRRAVDPIQSLKRQLSHAPDLRTAL